MRASSPAEVNLSAAAFRTIVSLRAARSSISPTLIRLIGFSIDNGFYAYFYDRWQNPAGYVLWAQVGEETAKHLGRTGEPPVYEYEWNEGAINLILDVCYWNASFSLRRDALEAALPYDVDQIAFYRRRRLTLIRRKGERLMLTKWQSFFVESN